MTAKAREKFYDLYAVLQGENIPDRNLAETEMTLTQKKKKRKTDKKEKILKNIPDALDKVLKEFYEEGENPEEKKEKVTKIGKDSLELKHENDTMEIGKKKKKKREKKQFEDLCKEFVAVTGDEVEGFNLATTPMKKKKKEKKDNSPDLPKKRTVEFNLKLNSTQLYDKKNRVSNSSDFSPSAKPVKGILKSKNLKPDKSSKNKNK